MQFNLIDRVYTCIFIYMYFSSVIGSIYQISNMSCYKFNPDFSLFSLKNKLSCDSSVLQRKFSCSLACIVCLNLHLACIVCLNLLVSGIVETTA